MQESGANVKKDVRFKMISCSVNEGIFLAYFILSIHAEGLSFCTFFGVLLETRKEGNFTVDLV